MVRFLADESQKRDPEKRGINFLINQDIHSGGSGTPAATTLGPDGQLVPAAAAEPVDMSAVTIKINPALTNIWLADLLAAIVKVADRPIKFAIEDYAVVFSPRVPEPTPLYVRTFKIGENTLIEGLHVPMGPVRTNGSGAVLVVLQALLDHLSKAGVDLDPHRYPGKAIFYTDRAGMLLVRGTLQDLDIVEREIASLVRPSKQDVDAGTLARDGKLLYEMDKLDEADAKLRAAVRNDPHNEAALNYLNLVSEAKYKRAARLRGESSLPNPLARTNLVYTGQGRQALIAKLNRIRLDSVSYDRVPLLEAVRMLAAEAKKGDPEKRGINFLINSATNETADLSTLPITINPPLKDIRLADVLDAIVKVASRPMKYSIEDYAVVFSARTGKESPPLYVRTFKVDQNALIESLHLVKGSAGTNALAGFAGALRDYFTRAGVDLDPTRNPGKAIFYDDSQSMLRVRATMQDLDLIEAAIQILMLVPDQDSGPNHSSDWLFGTNGARSGRILRLERPSGETWTAGYDTNSAKRAEVGRTWTNPVNRELLPVPNPSARTMLVDAGPGRGTIITNLDRIRLDKVSFDGQPLSEVVRFLSDQSKKRDPEKRGVNFLVVAATNGAADLSSLPITINPPLKDVRLADVLAAIVKVAGKPIKYSIEDDAVVFSAKTGTDFYVRTFKVDPNTMVRGLQSAKVPLGTNGLGAIDRALRDYFARVGVDLDPTNNPGKSIFFNDRQGMLIIRATMLDLDIIEAAIQVLTYVPPQINIKCKVVEVSQDDIQALGLDWQLGNVSANNAVSTSTNPPGVANAASVILTDPQFRMVLKALQQRSGAQLLAQPEVTTLSARQAQMKMTTIQRVVTGISERALTPPGITTTNGDESPLYVTEPIEFGQTVDVVACLLADGYTIALTVIPTAIEFLGYVKNPTNRVAVYINGNRKSVTLDRPQVRRRQMSATPWVWDGQTVVLRVPPAEKMTKIDDQLPMVAKSPLAGPAFHIEPETANKKTLLIFVTPTLIDPAGNLIHVPEEMPFARDGIPPQPAR